MPHILFRLFRRPAVSGLCLMLVIGGALLLSGCKPAQKTGPTEIVYWTGWSGDELAILQKLVDEYNETNKDGVRVRMLSVFNSYQKVRIAFAGGDVPDICSAVWSAELAGYAMRGALEPLDDYLKSTGRRPEEWQSGSWDMVQYHGKTWGLLATNYGIYIVYNKDIFDAKGLKPPTTLEEFDRLNEALIVRDQKGSFKQYGMRPSSLLDWAYIFGGHWFEPETGKITANHPKNVEALRYLQSFARKHDIRRMEVFESTFGSNETPNGAFFTGKQAMIPTGPWMTRALKRYAPKDFRYSVFPYPAPPGGRQNYTPLGSSVFTIPAASKHKKEAWAFLNWLMLPEQNVRFCSKIGNGSALVEVTKMPVMNEVPLMRISNKLAGGPNAIGPPQMPIWPAYMTAIQRAEDQGVHGLGDAKALLDDVQRKMEREMKRVEKEAVY